jgi:hypothetical protein
MDKQQETALLSKLISYSTYVILPVVFGNLIYWANDQRQGRQVKPRVRISILLASLGLAHMVHTLCAAHANMQRWEVTIIWGTSIFTEQLLKFLYLSFWDMVKQWFINWLHNFLPKK